MLIKWSPSPAKNVLALVLIGALVEHWKKGSTVVLSSGSSEQMFEFLLRLAHTEDTRAATFMLLTG